MVEEINEQISVNLLSNHLKRSVMPWVLYWRGRRYIITKIGLHHTIYEGKTLCHIFAVTDGTTMFRLQLDTMTLQWRLLAIDS